MPATLWIAVAAAAGFLHDLAHEAEVRVAAAIAARPPPLVPPVPIALHWSAKKLGALDLGAPLVGLVAADGDGDGRAELYAVTSREVVVLAAGPRGIHELGRAPFVGEAAVPAPRDPVGAAVADGRVVVAWASPWQRGVRVSIQGGRVTSAPDPVAGAPVCDARLALVPGRDYFAGDVYAARCRDIVDAAGHTAPARATLALGGKLTVAVGGVTHEYGGVGYAFDVADLDRDGTPELVWSGAGAPGDADAVKVVAFGADERRPMFRKSFNGGVAGVVVADVDGDGALDVIVAVRLLGSTRIDLWRLD